MANDGWDLHAVVRSCTTATAAADENTPAAMDVQEDGIAAVATTAAVTSISFDDVRSAHEQPSVFNNYISFIRRPEDFEHHARKRKSRSNKMVVEIREEDLSNDGWAWRKYGQKPIKGSPYPRNYYRCSTTRDCLARRQVERSPMDTSIFIVSYSGEHLHPRPPHLSSLAGTTRSTRFNVVTTDMPEQPPCSSSSPASTSSYSPTASLKEDETEMDEDIDGLTKKFVVI